MARTGLMRVRVSLGTPKYAQVVELEYTPVSDTGSSDDAGSTPALCTIWEGSESANAADCKSAPFGGSGLDTHPAHQTI